MPDLVSCVWKSHLALLALLVFSIALNIWLRELKICLLCSRNLASPGCPGCWGSSSDFQWTDFVICPPVYGQCVPDSSGCSTAKNSSFFCEGFIVSARCGKLISEEHVLPYELICQHKKISYVLCAGLLSECDTQELAFTWAAPQQSTGSLKPGHSQAVLALALTHSRQQRQLCSFVCLLQFWGCYLI